MIDADYLRFKKDQIYIIADKETEGLTLHSSRPWQMSWIVLRGDNTIEEHDHFLWWEDLNVSPEAAAVTRFNYDEYKSRAEDPKKILRKYRAQRDDPSIRIIMHNGLGYDSMIEQVWARAVNEPVDYSWLLRLIDTNCIAKAIKKNIKPDISSLRALLAFQFKMQSLVEKGLKTSLSTLAKEAKIQYDYANLHRGLNDINLNALVWNKMKWQVEI